MDEDLVDDTETMSTGTFSVDPRRGTVFLAALAPTRYAGGVHGLELLLALAPDTLVVRVKEGPDAAPRCLRLPVSAEALGDSAGASSAQAAGDFQGVEAVGAQTDCNLFQFRPPCDFGACGSVKLWHSSRRQVICGLETLSRGEGAQAAMAAGAHLSLADLATCRDLAGGDGEAPPTPTMPAAWTQDGKCILGPGSQRLLKEDDTAQGSYPDDMRAADCWSACVARGSYGCCRINYDWTPARCHWDPTGMTSTPTTGSAHWASNIQAEPGDNPIGCEVYASNASWCDEPGRDLEGAAADKCCACGGGEPPHDLGAAGAGGALLEDASCLPADGAEAPWLSLDALAVPPPGPGAEPAVAVVSAVVQGADALGLLPAPARAVLSRMILTLPLPKAPTATPATPMEDVVLRIANAGFTGWRPNVAEVKFYSDQLCTKRVTRERLHNSSGWNHAPGQKKYTPDLAIDGSEAAQSHWRPQCSSCQPDEAWIEFAFKPSTVIQCIEANNLGKGSGGGKHWDGGIRVYNVTDQIYRDGARQVVVGYAEGNTFILEEERGPTTATLTTSVVEAPAVDIFSEDLKAFSFLYASEYTERSPKRDGATPNRPHLGPRADSVGTVQAPGGGPDGTATAVGFLPSDGLARLGQARAAWLAEHHCRHLSLVYPRAPRRAPSNFNLAAAWAAGAQLAALALGGPAEGAPLVQAGRFAHENGGCGYVLKPECMRGDSVEAPKALELKLRVLGARALPSCEGPLFSRAPGARNPELVRGCPEPGPTAPPAGLARLGSVSSPSATEAGPQALLVEEACISKALSQASTWWAGAES
ncbi:unnamed protein product [Prorocentrum cordatum]|uniref:PI-PLC Y-box domain-containing protein n=1 Tax=Prorocentrum cordatum TaxID=2364126 RepID=A0ABN9T378_9DINO|nr:unnamed protein product [Polarella glacialis]